MPKSKWSAFFSLLVVFLSGAVVGALAHRLYMVTTAYSGSAPPPKSPEEVRRRIIQDLRTKVHLDDQQVAELNSIMDETRDQFHQMRDQMSAQGRTLHDQQWQKVRAMLRPDQQPLYDKWRADRDAEIRKRREQQKQGGIAPRQ